MNINIKTISSVITLATAMVLLPISANAAPVSGQEVSFDQPNGTAITVRAWGDEFYRDIESRSGYTLVFDNGWLCYAKLSADGREYVSTGVRAANSPPPLGLPKGIRINKESIREKQNKKRKAMGHDKLLDRARRDHETRRAERAKVAQVRSESLGKVLFSADVDTIVGLTVPVGFGMTNGDSFLTQIDHLLNKSGVPGSTRVAAGSLRDYFLDVSDGKLDYTNVITPLVNVSKPYSYYDNGDFDVITELISEILELLSEIPNIDWDRITKNPDGTVKAFNIIRINSDWGKTLWPHASIYMGDVTVNGIKIDRYQISPLEDRIGLIAHENGHSVFGWPDLYYGFYNVGDNCLMTATDYDYPQMPNPYFRDLAGWVNPTILESNTYALATNSRSDIIRFDRDEKERLYIEARMMSVADIRNRSISLNGIIIWHTYRDKDDIWFIKEETDMEYPLIRIIDGRTFNPSHNQKYHDGEGVPITITGINQNTNPMTFTATVTEDSYTATYTSSAREIPNIINNKDAAVIVPSGAAAFEITAGPNPVTRDAGAVRFFVGADVPGRPSSEIGKISGTLTIYDAVGNVVRKINVADGVGNRALHATPLHADTGVRRVVGVWDLRDANGRSVPAGAYLVRGVVKTVGGKHEKISLVVGVR